MRRFFQKERSCGVAAGYGLRYLYSATTSQTVAKRTALQQVVHTFFGGSLTQMMTALVSEGSWSDDELAALRAEIDRVRRDNKERRKP